MVTKGAAMSFSQFGFPYNATSQFFVSANPTTTCCDSISRSVSDGTGGSQSAAAAAAAAAASFCCPPYDNRLLASSRSELNAALGMYSSPYAAAAAASHNYANYFPYSTEPSAIYSTLNPQYDIKDGAGSLHSGITQTAAYYPYDHSLGQYQYDRYGTVDFNSTARRKNATRETTSTLKTWLYEHRKNPYPTKGEKIMLAIITKMTLTQVSTWFANARRRLKKENKMTWSPKNKATDDRKDELSKNQQDCVTKDSRDCKEEKDLHLSDLDDMDEDDCDKLQSQCEKVAGEQRDLQRALVAPGGPHRRDCGSELQLNAADSFQGFACSLKPPLPPLPSDFLEPVVPTKAPPSSSSSSSSSASSLVLAGTPSLSHFEAVDKPRIWSLARTAASGVLLSPELRSAEPGVDCQLQEEQVLTQAHSLFPQGGATLHHKLYGATAGYGHKDVQLHCSTYSLLPDACQYSSGPGFPGGKAEADDLDEGCETVQDDKVTAFRPLMKR